MFQVKECNIIDNIKITKDIYLLKVSGQFSIVEGQFFMLKTLGDELTLYRPISVFDCDENSVTFLYFIKGKGTEIFSKLKKDDNILLHGPYGNGFPKIDNKIALVGGGIGMAPLLLTAKRNPDSITYIGIRENLYSNDEIENLKNIFSGINVNFKVGGLITDIIDFNKFDTIFTCGPEVMMKAVSKKHNNVFVSLEKHMGCAVGACLSCSCKTSSGLMKKVCQDGPVFNSKEVYYED